MRDPAVPLHPSPSHIMRTDAYLRIGNPPEPPQSPMDTTRATEKGHRPTQPPLMLSHSCITRTDVFPRVVDVPHTTSGSLGQISSCITWTDAFLRVKNLPKLLLPLLDTPPARTTSFGMYSCAETPSGPLKSTSNTSPMCMTRFDAYLRIGNPSDTTRTTEQGPRSSHLPNNMSPSCVAQTDVSLHALDMPRPTSDPLGQISTRFTHHTRAIPPSSCRRVEFQHPIHTLRCVLRIPCPVLRVLHVPRPPQHVLHKLICIYMSKPVPNHCCPPQTPHLCVFTCWNPFLHHLRPIGSNY